MNEGRGRWEQEEREHLRESPVCGASRPRSPPLPRKTLRCRLAAPEPAAERPSRTCCRCRPSRPSSRTQPETRNLCACAVSQSSTTHFRWLSRKRGPSLVRASPEMPPGSLARTSRELARVSEGARGAGSQRACVSGATRGSAGARSRCGSGGFSDVNTGKSHFQHEPKARGKWRHALYRKLRKWF